MLRLLLKKLRYLTLKAQMERLKEEEEEEQKIENAENIYENDKNISKNINGNLNTITNILGKNNDIVIRRLNLEDKKKTKAALIFVDGLTDMEMIDESVIRPLLLGSENMYGLDIEKIQNSLIHAGSIKQLKSLNQILDACLSGNSVLIFDGFSKALMIDSKKWDKRSVSEPETEPVVKGPREGFTENFRTNTSLLRRKIKSPSLRMEQMIIGTRTKTNICLAYLTDVADPQIIKELKRRLNNIKIDSILEAGYLEQFIEDSPFSVFSTIGYTEKPDAAAAKILEGRIAIIIEGTPFVLTAPMLFAETLQTTEDYYTRTIYSSIIRLLRFLCLLITTLAPAVFVAFTTFHQEMIPTTLLFTLVNSHEEVPFPALIEALVLLIIFEILREAGLRLPRPTGQTVSIVGALVMGETAVAAGFVGAPMVITIAITAVSGFAVPQLSEPAVPLRIIFLLLAGTMGGFGVMIGVLGLLVHMASLNSFGVPYMSSIAPINLQAMKDVFLRFPLWTMKKRPWVIAYNDKIRQSIDSKPTKNNND